MKKTCEDNWEKGLREEAEGSFQIIYSILLTHLLKLKKDEMAIFFAVSMVLGLVANAIVFIVSFQDYRSQKKSFVSTYFVLRYLWREKSRKTTTNILSLCLADTFQLTLLPFKIDSRYYRACWRYGAIGCHIHNCFTNFNLFVSIFFLGNTDYK